MPMLVYFSGDWDGKCSLRYGRLTHDHMGGWLIFLEGSLFFGCLAIPLRLHTFCIGIRGFSQALRVPFFDGSKGKPQGTPPKYSRYGNKETVGCFFLCDLLLEQNDMTPPPPARCQQSFETGQFGVGVGLGIANAKTLS